MCSFNLHVWWVPVVLWQQLFNVCGSFCFFLWSCWMDTYSYFIKRLLKLCQFFLWFLSFVLLFCLSSHLQPSLCQFIGIVFFFFLAFYFYNNLCLLFCVFSGGFSWLFVFMVILYPSGGHHFSFLFKCWLSVVCFPFCNFAVILHHLVFFNLHILLFCSMFSVVVVIVIVYLPISFLLSIFYLTNSV